MSPARAPLALSLALACGSSDGDPKQLDGTASSDGTTAAAVASSTSSTSSDATTTGVATTGSAAAAFDIVEQGTTFIATSTTDPRFVIEIDCDDETLDDRYYGIAPRIDGNALEVAMYGGPRFPLFTPDFDAGETIACIRVESDESALSVRLEAGSYQTLDPAADDLPVPLEVTFAVVDGRLVANAAGLFYMMLTRADTELTITHGQVDMLAVTTTTAAFTTDFDGVTAIAVDDSIYGPIAIDGDIARLQVQLYDDGSEGFELDLDHAFKDFGQQSVALVLELG